MKVARPLFVLSFFLLTAWKGILAQQPPEIIIIDSLNNPDQIETYHLKRTGIIFGKSKTYIIGYGTFKSKEGITTSDAARKKGIYGDATRYKFKVEFLTDDGAWSDVAGEVNSFQEYEINRDVLLETFTSIESESVGFSKERRFTTARFTTSLATDQWILKYEIHRFDESVQFGTINNGSRIIHIIQVPVITTFDGKTYSSHRTEFIENGISVSAIDDGDYLFRAGLDPHTKLVLCTAMETIGK